MHTPTNTHTFLFYEQRFNEISGAQGVLRQIADNTYETYTHTPHSLDTNHVDQSFYMSRDLHTRQRFNEIEGAQGALLAVTHTHTMMSITPNGDYTTKPHPQHMLERVQSLG